MERQRKRCMAAVLLLCLLLSACGTGGELDSGNAGAPAEPQIAGEAVDGVPGLYLLDLAEYGGNGGCLMRNENGLLLVTFDTDGDTGAHIVRLDPATGKGTVIAVIPDLYFCDRSKMDFDRAGNLVLSDGDKRRFLLVDPTGRGVTELPYPEEAAAATVCFRSKDGSKIYYSDQKTGNLCVYDTAETTGKILAELTGLSGVAMLQYYEEGGAIALSGYDARRDLFLCCYYGLEDGALRLATQQGYTVAAAQGSRSVVYASGSRDMEYLDYYDSQYPRMRRSIAIEDLENCSVGGDLSRNLIVTSRGMNGEQGQVVFLNAYDIQTGNQTGNLRWNSAGSTDESVTVSMETMQICQEGVATMLMETSKNYEDGMGTIHLYLLQWDLREAGEPSNQGENRFAQGVKLEGEGEDDPTISGKVQDYKHQMEARYGVKIYIGSEANRYFPDYKLDVLPDEKLIQSSLEELNEALSRYPSGFFPQLLNDDVHSIGLYLGGRLSATNTYSLEEAGAFACVYGQEQILAFDMRQYNTTGNLYHEVAHAIDRKIERAVYHGQCDFSEDTWSGMNPAGFSYEYSYVTQSYDPANTAQSIHDNDYSQVYFIDTYAKTYPTEDRARLMEYLLGGETADPCYVSPHLQKKLEYYFAAIRQAFDDSGWDAVAWESRLSSVKKNG